MRNLREDKLYIQAFREIRSYMLRNGLKAGDLLPTEQAMSEMLGVSRNVLREAIKSMELMGMVSACPGKGTVIKEFSLDFVFQNVLFDTVSADSTAIPELLDIRKKIELGYMHQAYQCLTDADVARLREILEAIKEKWKHSAYFHQEDRDFHMAIFAPLHNKTLDSLMSAIWAVDENFKTEEKFKHLGSTIDKHESIVFALEQHNPEAFEAAMLMHFSTGKYSSQNNYEG